MVKKPARKSPAKTKSRTPAAKKRAKAHPTATKPSKRSGHSAAKKAVAKKSPRTTAKKKNVKARSPAKKKVKKPQAVAKSAHWRRSRLRKHPS